MSRHTLTDQECIRNYLPKERNGSQVVPGPVNVRRSIGFFGGLCTGSSWKDISPAFRKHKTIYIRFRRWTREGRWQRIIRRLLHRLDAAGKVDRTLWCVDGSVIRAHRVDAGDIIGISLLQQCRLGKCLQIIR